LRLPIKVVPGASRDEISGWLGDRLKLRVRAPAESGNANRAVCRLLARSLNVPSASIQISAGSAAPLKTIQISGIGPEELRKRLTAG